MRQVSAFVLGFVALAAASVSQATPVASRAALQTVIGGPGTVEGFQSFSLGAGGVGFSCDTGSVFNASSTCNSQGPGLVDANIEFIKSTGGFQMDAVGYFGATSNEFLIGAGPGQPLTVNFVVGVQAFGLDLRAFQGFAATATMTILGLDDSTVLGNLSGIALGGSGAAVFAGWTDTAGIGGFRLTQTGQSWSPIVDNIEWGPTGNAVPEPSSLALMGLGLLGVAALRRRA